MNQDCWPTLSPERQQTTDSWHSYTDIASLGDGDDCDGGEVW